MTSTPAQPATPKPSPPRSLRARLIRILTGVAVGLALLLGVITLLTRTPLCKVWLLPAIGSAMGVKVEARTATVLGSGTVVLEDAVFILPGIDGPASRFLEIRRLEVDPDIGRPGIPISRMRVDGAVFRVSQATDSEQVNVQLWNLPGTGGTGTGTGARPRPPRVDLRSASIELGEHGPGTGTEGFRVLKRINVRGSVVPTNDSTGSWAIDLHETDPRNPSRALASGIAVGGRIDDAGVHLAMTQASLADWPASAVPSRHRRVFEMLNIEGEITRTFLEVPWEGEVAAGIVLENVAMTLPFERQLDERVETLPEHQREDTAQGVRLQRSGGTVAFIGSGVRATLDGWIEDFPFGVMLDYQGLSATSAFRCELSSEDFRLSDEPVLMPFLPHSVWERLADFRDPTGLVDTRVLIERGEPVDGVEAATRFSGTMQFREGRAAYKSFPYFFEQMEADVSFNEDEVRIERIVGVSPSGARLAASGHVSPLGDDAEVVVRVTVTGAPIDPVLIEALGPKQAPLIDSIFSPARFEQLEAAGLVISPRRRDELLSQREAHQRQLAELSTVSGAGAREQARAVRAASAAADRALRAPVFNPGGLIDITVVVRRYPGPDNIWDNTIDVQLARAGILPAHFPVPIEATNVHFTIVERHLTLVAGDFRPLPGGTATVSVEAMVPGDKPGQENFDPNISLSARGVPLDRLVLHAIGHAGDPKDQAHDTGANWLDPMQSASVVGTIDADVTVLRRPGADLGFDVAATFDALRAAPPAKPDLPGTIALQASRGRVLCNENEVTIAFDAQAISQDARGAVARPAGEFQVTARTALRPDAQGRKPFVVTTQGHDVLLGAAIERIVGLVAPEAETALADLRARYAPGGTVRGSVEVTGSLGDPTPQVAVAIADPRDFEFDLEPGRVGFSGGQGWLRFTLPAPGRPGELIADAFESQITLAGQPQGRLEVSGRVELLPDPNAVRRSVATLIATAESPGPGESPDAAAPTVQVESPAPTTPPAPTLLTGAIDLTIAVRDASMDSALTWAAIEAFAPDRGADLLPYDLAGVFDADMTTRRATQQGEMAFDGVFRPRTLALNWAGQRLSFADVRGQVRLDAHAGQAESIRAVGPELSLVGDASWGRAPDGQIVLDATYTADAPGITPAVRTILPPALLTSLEEMLVKVDGPLSVSQGVLHATFPAPPAPDPANPQRGVRPPATIHASGAVHVANVSALIGMPIEQARGTVWFDATAAPDAPPSYTLNIVADSLRAAGLFLTNLKARVTSGQREGEVLVPLIEADAYGGRLAGSGHMTPAARQTTDLKYDLSLQASGIRFASLLEDPGRVPTGAHTEPTAPTPDIAGLTPPPSTEPADASRGLLAADVTLGGVVGRNATRRGQGSVQIGGGPVMSLPLLMPIINVANLQLPATTPLDVAFAEFYVQGDTVTFEELSAFTRSVEIWGYGTLNWVSMGLDMRFNTRSTSPIPVVSELLESVRNELVSTRVRGTVDEPDIGTIQFQGTRRVLDTLLGDGPDEQSRRLTEIGERARLNRSRALRAGERLRWLVESQVEGRAPGP